MLSIRNTPLLYIEKRYSPLLLPTGLHDWFPRSCIFRSPISMEWKTFGIVICVDWLMTNDVEHSYMHFLVSWLPSFLKCLGILLTCCIEILIWKKKSWMSGHGPLLGIRYLCVFWGYALSIHLFIDIFSWETKLFLFIFWDKDSLSIPG